MSAPLDRPLYGASWGTAILRFFGNYSIFRGRASPSEYWWWALTNVLVISTLNIVASLSGAKGWQNGAVTLPLAGGPGGVVTTVPGAIALIYGLGTLLPNLALTWRRLHDTNRSGAWFFLTFVPVIGWIILFFFLIGSPREEGRRFD